MNACAVEEDRFDVDGEDAVELRLLDLHDRLVAMRRAGIVDDDVDAPKGLDRGARRALHIATVRDVALERDRRRDRALGRRLGDFALHVQARDPRAFANESLGDAVAEPLPRAGHQRRLALQSHVFPSVPPLSRPKARSLRFAPRLTGLIEDVPPSAGSSWISHAHRNRRQARFQGRPHPPQTLDAQHPQRRRRRPRLPLPAYRLGMERLSADRRQHGRDGHHGDGACARQARGVHRPAQALPGVEARRIFCWPRWRARLLFAGHHCGRRQEARRGREGGADPRSSASTSPTAMQRNSSIRSSGCATTTRTR